MADRSKVKPEAPPENWKVYPPSLEPLDPVTIFGKGLVAKAIKRSLRDIISKVLPWLTKFYARLSVDSDDLPEIAEEKPGDETRSP